MQQYIDALTSELVTLAQAGDGKALAAVLAASDPRLRAMARRVQKSSDWEETLVQYGRMGVVKALRMYQVGRGSFWTFAYMHVKGSMIDGYAAELGLSSDARKAYPKVVRTYRQLAANHTRPPASAEVAAACGVTAGMVEQIVNVLFRTWLTLDEIAEHTPDALPPPDTPQSLYNAAPDTLIAAQDDLAQRRSLVQELYTSCLGADEAARFLVLQILREGSGGYDYGWEEIAAALCGTAGPPHPDWAHTVAAEFADWTRLPPTWAAVRELFLRQHPAPTSAYLRQRFSQDRRALGDIAEQTQDADPLLIATPSPYKTPSPYNSCLDRYPDIQISHKVRISQTCTVRVAVTIQPAVQQFAAAVMAAVFPESNEAVIVDVVITADDFEILDNTVKQLIVPFDKDSDPIVFRLRPEAIGKKTVRVEFYQDDRYIGGAQVITEVTDGVP